MLGLPARSGPVMQSSGAQPSPAASRFLLPVSQAEFQLTSILESLAQDPWPVAAEKRPVRCTGVALSIAVGLLESTYPGTGAHIMLFAGGPASDGPGAVVGLDLKDTIRSHHDIERDSARYTRSATKVCLILLQARTF